MKSSAEAQQIAQRWIHENQGADQYLGAFTESDPFFAFYYVGDEDVFGPGPVVLDKRDGRVFFDIGSAYSLDQAIEMHKEHDCNESFVRQRFPDFDIRRNYLILITNVHDRDRYFELPGHIGLVFVRRQEIHGEKLKVPIRTRSLPDNIIKQLLETIDRNPVVLGQQSMHSQLYELLVFSESEKIFSLAIRDWPDLQRAFDLVAANSST